MARTQYKFDSDSLEFKEIKLSFYERIIKLVAVNFSPAILLAVGFFAAFSYLFDTPEERRLKHENQQLENQVTYLYKKAEDSEKVLAELQKRDDNIYRASFGIKKIPTTVRQAGIGGSQRYKNLENLDASDELIKTSKLIDKLAKQIVVQSKSYDELEDMINKKTEMIACLPAIQPVANKDLRHQPYGYGPRIDPVYKTPAFHHGMDFSAPIGTEIYATGDGIVTRADAKSKGYGNHVRINHGFGYLTLYGHMSKILVKAGQKVKRGDLIGLVGNTGKSVGSHLHYEVHQNGKTVNPINFYWNDLSPEEYQNLIKKSNETGLSMD